MLQINHLRVCRKTTTKKGENYCLYEFSARMNLHSTHTQFRRTNGISNHLQCKYREVCLQPYSLERKLSERIYATEMIIFILTKYKYILFAQVSFIWFVNASFLYFFFLSLSYFICIVYNVFSMTIISEFYSADLQIIVLIKTLRLPIHILF